MSAPGTPSVRLTPSQALIVPVILAGVVVAVGLLGPDRGQPALVQALVGAGVVLAVWSAALWFRGRHRRLALAVALRPQHYVQASAQAAIFLYWGWYWSPVYESADLIAAQLVFAYAFEMLLVWSRRDGYTLGFGPFPVIFSINLFFWFKPEWFWLQFLMVAGGFVAKELIRWTRDGRRVHVFNPSSFPLAVASLLLLATGASNLTWGREIASTQFHPPQMYLVLFLLGVPNGLLFGVAWMTMAAVITTVLFGLAYASATGIPYFFDTNLPIAVFLGMHFLFTDPTTAPSTDGGRLVFGTLYGLATVALYALLGSAGLPTFYDKLLPVPVLNLSVRAIDRAVRSWVSRAPGVAGRSAGTGRRPVVSLVTWTAVFGLLSASNALSDEHPGQWAPFWDTACREGRPYACDYLITIQASSCDAGSGWACNELGILQTEILRDREQAVASFTRGCDLGYAPACGNRVGMNGEPARTAPPVADLPVVLRGSKAPIREREPTALRALACERGFVELCAGATR